MMNLMKLKPFLPYIIGGSILAFFILFRLYPSSSTLDWEEEANLDTPAASQSFMEDADQEILESVDIFVDVKGAVSRPGVYEMEEGMRVKDALALANGITEEANEAAVNLALRVHDEMVIYVPFIGEEEAMITGVGENDSAGGGDQLNINGADQGEIETLPGIGPSKAAAIILYREEQGPFSQIEEIKNVPGIGDKTFEQLEALIRTR
ncbi:helix-hairpin-helix domain-containing protein [Alteribacter populi]|uniref:helix-hairpin-helix domain-containing protein n=1 Tax=Alteribacter populi TaxID=2011011 RepID=UPI0018E1FF50|nr:helix-hairpin-helix domain-containing protein [Alteribacter populi]